MDTLAMGNYGVYVWSCFALTLIVIVFSDWRARAHHNQVYRDMEVRIKALEDRQ
ncbi:MAG: heme exporter protein CcmD [Woeseiaceae bacterium]|jgi:heme exporter protein CcmD|nr:heme exporter protein CcmD [Woeseiaceae bacterium]